DPRQSDPFPEQIGPLLPDLLQPRPADVADADPRQRQPLARLEEALVNRVQRAPLLRLVDDAGDVALGSALGDRADVDVLPAERLEYLAGDARPPLHSLADHREDRLPILHVDEHRLLEELELELVPDRVDRG